MIQIRVSQITMQFSENKEPQSNQSKLTMVVRVFVFLGQLN